MDKNLFSKTLAIILTLLMLMASIPLSTVYAEEIPNGFSYEIADGEVTITGYTGSASVLEIPGTIEGKPVTSIGYKAFCGCTSLTSVIIPNGAVSIDVYAFLGCKFLRSITIPDSVTSIGQEAFSYTAYYDNSTNWENGVLYINNALIEADTEKVTEAYEIKSGTKVIADYAFYDCSSLTSVNISNSVTHIGRFAFLYCRKLASVNISNSVTNIGKGAFWECTRLTSITIPDSVTNIGQEAFYGCESLTSITIPDRVTSIGDSAFSGCESLTSVNIPDSVTSIGDSVFYGCESLTSVSIPDSVTSIGRHAFSKCKSLTSITIPDGVTSIGASAFYNTAYYNDTSNWENGVLYIGNILLDADVEITGAYGIKAGTDVIAESAFYGCKGLSSISIPDSVTSIGDSAFSGCESLQEFIVSENNSAFKSIDGVLFLKDMAKLVLYPQGSFNTDYTIPYGVTCIGRWAFGHCTSLTSVTIPDSVTYIDDYAFADCINITSITIPDSVTSIADDAFSRCENVTIYGVAGSYAEEYANENSIPFTALTTPSDNTQPGSEYAEKIPEGLSYEIANGEVTITGYTGSASVLEILGTIEEKPVTSIGDRAFYDCESLTSITIPDSVTSIGDYAFYYCKSLTSITIPDGVTSIGDYAFGACTSLTSVNISGSVTSIGDYAFSGCKNVTVYGVAGSYAEEYANSNSIPFTALTTPSDNTQPGSEYGLGDVNKDSKLNIRDATLIQKYLAKLADLDEEAVSLADFDQNGKVNVKDATAIQKHLAGFVVDTIVNTSGGDVETTIPENLVIDAYSYSYSELQGDYEYHIPKICIDDSKVDLINEVIWDWCYEKSLKEQIKNAENSDPTDKYSSVYFLDMDYKWAVNRDVLSLCISKLYNGCCHYYKIYNISLTTYELVSDDAIIQQAGYSPEEYSSRLKQVMASAYLDYNMVDEYTDIEQYIADNGSKIIKTLSDDNLRETEVYLNEYGELCIVGIRHSSAGAEYYKVLYNLDTYEINQYYLDIVDEILKGSN